MNRTMSSPRGRVQARCSSTAACAAASRPVRAAAPRSHAPRCANALRKPAARCHAAQVRAARVKVRHATATAKPVPTNQGIKGVRYLAWRHGNLLRRDAYSSSRHGAMEAVVKGAVTRPWRARNETPTGGNASSIQPFRRYPRLFHNATANEPRRRYARKRKIRSAAENQPAVSLPPAMRSA